MTLITKDGEVLSDSCWDGQWMSEPTDEEKQQDVLGHIARTIQAKKEK